MSAPTIAVVVMLFVALWSHRNMVQDERVQIAQAQADYDRSLEALPFPY